MLWTEFRETIPQNDWPDTRPLPYIRVNPYLNYEPPKLDDKHSILRIQGDVQRELRKPSALREAQRVAYQLIASTFYYTRTGPLVSGTGVTYFDGEYSLRNAAAFPAILINR